MRLGTAIEHLVDNYKYASDKEWIQNKVAWALYYTWKEADDRKTENSSEIPNNCEHITEDGVTCAKYPACDDCLDNPLNKVKGSKRLLKGKDEPQTNADQRVQRVGSVETMSCQECKHWDDIRNCWIMKSYGECHYEPKTEPTGYNLTPVETEPQTEVKGSKRLLKGKDEPETERSE